MAKEEENRQLAVMDKCFKILQQNLSLHDGDDILSSIAMIEDDEFEDKGETYSTEIMNERNAGIRIWK